MSDIIEPRIVAKLKSSGEIVGPNGEDLLVCDCCGNIWTDNGDPHFCCPPCGRMFCRMNGADMQGLAMARIDLLSSEDAGEST